jgi:hypothetical protein
MTKDMCYLVNWRMAHIIVPSDMEPQTFHQKIAPFYKEIVASRISDTWATLAFISALEEPSILPYLS